MTVWIVILLIAGMLYVGFDYTRLWLKMHRGNESAPQRFIFITTRDGDYTRGLSMEAMRSRISAGCKVAREENGVGYMKFIFDNDDEVILYDYEKARIGPLNLEEIDGYEQLLFFDTSLPQGAERAVINALGLQGYMVKIGICKEKK